MAIDSTDPPSGGQDAAQAGALPERFGRYRILRQLGKGGMGSVYLAHDTQLDRRVALKVPRFTGRDGPRVLERFVREARAAALLGHPNLCPVYDVNEVQGVHFLTMAYIEGRPLSEFIRGGGDKGTGSLSQRQTAALIRKLAQALQEAHSAGVVHRDLKPANIMINRRGEPVIMDFGLAKRLGVLDGESAAAFADNESASHVSTSGATPNQAHALTQAGTILGTPAYMSPEQVRGNVEALGPACDIYALGVILYEMLTGQLPFRGPTQNILAQILAATPEPPSRIRPGVDPRLERICVTAMAKEPRERYANMAALAAALGDYLRSSGQSPAARLEHPAEKVFAEFAAQTKLTSIQTRPSLSGLRLRRFPNWAWIGLAAAAVLLLSAVILYIATDYGTIEIELSDPAANVELRVDGNVVPITRLAEPLQLRAGRHQLTITGTNFEPVNQPFTVRRGESESLKIALAPKAAIVRQAKPLARPDARALLEQKKQPAGEIARLTVSPGYWINRVAFTPDGRQLLAAGGNVHLFDVESGREVYNVMKVNGARPGLALSADGRVFLTGHARDPVMRLGEVATGNSLRTFQGHQMVMLSGQKFALSDAVLSADGKVAVSAGFDAALVVWDVDGGKEIRRLQGHASMATALAISADGRRLLSAHTAADEKSLILLWDLESGERIRSFEGHQAAVKRLRFLREGLAFLSAASDGSVRRWDVNTGCELVRVEHDGPVHSVAVSPDETRALSAALPREEAGRFIRLWDLLTGQELHRFPVTHHVLDLAFTADGIRAASCDTDGTVILWRLPPPLEVKVGEIRRFAGHSGQVWSVGLSPDGRRAVSCGHDGTLRLWDVETAEEIKRMNPRAGVLEGVAFHPDGRRALSCGRDGLVRLWDLETGKTLRQFKGHGGTIRFVAVSPDGGRAISAGSDRTARVWDLEAGRELGVLAGHANAVKWVAFSPDGRRGLTAALDGTVRQWDLETFQEIGQLTGHAAAVWCVGYSPDGRTALSGGGHDAGTDHTLRRWSLKTFKELRRFEPGTGKVICVAFSPDGRRALSGHGNTIHLWNLEKDKEVCRLEGHTSPVHGVAFLPDDRRAISCAWDGTLRLWRLPEPWK